jgi:serine phosphatase RsbU (regulator of sigma subunit)
MQNTKNQNHEGGFDRQQLIQQLRRQIEVRDFMRVYQQRDTASCILVVAPDRDLATVASYLVDGVSGESFRELHAAGDVLGIYEAWDSPYATFDVEPGDEVRVLFAPPAFIVQRTDNTLE